MLLFDTEVECRRRRKLSLFSVVHTNIFLIHYPETLNWNAKMSACPHAPGWGWLSFCKLCYLQQRTDVRMGL